jgi:hypothetical protein
MALNQCQLDATRQQMHEIVNIMETNSEKLKARYGNLSEAEERAELIQAGSKKFQEAAGNLKNKHFWENMKMQIIIGVVISVVILIIIIVATTV